ncbi:hypothetical protein [Aureibacillus halotolerans]|uniref:hypothetical protein n=1 Tax=Aureibacillus halotolerans TaxID=1508390 RepID=UPI0010608968|nr:hypothetical protein [Aureibacillus halotolerans]
MLFLTALCLFPQEIFAAGTGDDPRPIEDMPTEEQVRIHTTKDKLIDILASSETYQNGTHCTEPSPPPLQGLFKLMCQDAPQEEVLQYIQVLMTLEAFYSYPTSDDASLSLFNDLFNMTQPLPLQWMPTTVPLYFNVRESGESQ